MTSWQAVGVPTDPELPRLVLGGTTLSVVGRANIYVCGVTPYDVTHLGHAATFVWVDAVDRVLRRLGVQVEVCRNITDVDDVLFEAAAKAGAQYERFAAVQQFHFDQDMTALSVRKPMHEPRAHTFITPVIDLAQSLLDNGHAYEAGGSVFLHGAPVATSSDCDEATAEALLRDNNGRLDDPNKRHPFDQAVWQASGPDEPAWPSPWGPGRPGWHAECTAMALTTYGPSLDLHAGGADLRFPHHAFEAAQAEAATGVTPFARSWMHVGTVRIDGVKMAKSTGNLVFVSDLVAQATGPGVRMLLLDRPWNAAWDYTPADLATATARLDALHVAAGRPSGSRASSDAVLAALADDLDVSRAVSLAIEEGGAPARELISVLAL
jgi:cysteinyl-tRNA synthetase